MNDKINGRTPEEIKLGLEFCMNIECPPECPYFGNEAVDCNIALNTDAVAAISQLIRERDEARNDLDTINYANTELYSAYDAMKRERDAAVRDLEANKRCETCMHYMPGYFCPGCRRGDKWQWKGV